MYKRQSIDRPEALDTGAIVMTGLDPANVVEAVEVVVSEQSEGKHLPADYVIDNCPERAVRYILSTHSRHHSWAGIRRPGHV